MLYLSPLPPSCCRVGFGAFCGVRGFLVFLASSARSACASSFCFCSAVCLRSIFGLAAVANRSVKPTRLRRAAYFLSLGVIVSNRQVTKVKRQGIDANLAPDAFAKWANDYLKCEDDYSLAGFSPVRHFLLCRAIELAIKAIHLNRIGQPEVKTTYGHDILKAYQKLPSEYQTLTEAEQDFLSNASTIYDGKEFEYFNPEDSLTGYQRFPNIETLRALAHKIVALPPNNSFKR